MKKLYSIIMLICLAIGNAWAGSNLYVLGEEVSTSTSWTRSASSFVSGATGTISLTADHPTLKFTNVKIPSSNSKKVVHNKIYMMMQIVFEGECELYSKDKVIQYDASTTLVGSASTCVRLCSWADEEVLYSNESRDDGAANLTITGFPYLEMYSKGDYCISHKYGDVTIKNSLIVMNGGKGTIHSNSYAHLSYSGVYLNDCFYGGNYNWISTGDSRDVATATEEAKGEKVKACKIIRGSEYTGVRLNGEPILTNDSRWNASTKTVTLNADVNASSNFTYMGAITVEKTGVTIDGGGKNFYGKKYGMDVYLRKSGETASIRNMALHGYDAGLYVRGGDYDYITIGDNVTLYGVDYAIYQGHITFSPSNGKTVTLMPAPGYAETTYGNLFRQKAIQASSITLNECSVLPEGLTVSGNTLVSGTTTWNGMAIIKGWEKYDLYVNGTQVHEKNKDNLTSLLGSNATGTLKFNPSTNTITMNNLKAAPSSSETKGYLIYSNYGNKTIAVEGENEITANTNSSYTMYFGGNGVTITKGSTSTSKLTLKGSPKYSFIRAVQSTIKDVSLYIDGSCPEGGIVSTVANSTSTISNATVSIKGAAKPLAGMWQTSGVYGEIPNSNNVATINPSTHKLVYCDDNGPTTNEVTENISIYPYGSYTITVGGSKPQSYSSTASVCFDELSERLYLRNANCGRIYAQMNKMRIHSIGDCKVTSSDNHALETNVNILLFTGPGTLTLTSDNNFAARLANYNAVVQVLNTTLKMNGKNGMVHPWNSSATDNQSMLYVINSRLEAHCPVGNGFALSGFCNLFLSDCNIYTPQGGSYMNRTLVNADGTVAWDMLILPYAPVTLTLDAYANNNSKLESYYGKEVIAKINNFTIKCDRTWRTICLPFDLTIPGSVMKGCEVRELTSIRQKEDVGILDFTKSVLEIKHDIPYLIRNTSGTDIVNPNFGVVKIQGDGESVQDGVVIDGETVFQGIYAQETGYYYPNLYALGNDLVLVNKKDYRRDAFGAVFFIQPGKANFYVAYTGSSEDDLIDGIREIDNGQLTIDNEATYDLSGRKYDARPSKPGFYIQKQGSAKANGKKLLVK